MDRLAQKYDIPASTPEAFIQALNRAPDSVLAQICKQEGLIIAGGRSGMIQNILDRALASNIPIIGEYELEQAAGEIKDRLQMISCRKESMTLEFMKESARKWMIHFNCARPLINETVNLQIAKDLVYLFEDFKMIVDVQCSDMGIVCVRLSDKISPQDWKLFFEFILGHHL
jgi:hypothetical protein